MNVIRTTATTSSDGTLTISLPLGMPNTKFDIAVVIQPDAANESLTQPAVDPWAGANAIRERLVATGRTFSDSTELIREDRDR